MPELSRRDVLRTVGVGLAAGTASAGSVSADGGWHAVASPTDSDLADVAHTASGAYAVGGGGVVLERRGSGTDDGAEWHTLTTTGPDGNGSNLHACAPTADGVRLWVAGASGALAELDVETNTVASHSAPDDVTDQFTSLVVAGSGDDATVFVADSSGHVHVSTGTERSEPGERTWTHATPGSGAAIRALARGDGGRVVAVDANGDVFARGSEGAWARIGIEDADAGLYDATVVGGRARVAGGTLYREGDDAWDATDPTERTLYDIAMGSCGCIHAVGASGTVLHRPGHDLPGGVTVARWLGLWEETHPVEADLRGVTLGDPHVAVGASGTVVEA
ncbi:PQQ-like beta-propeller repeat protein [Halarchaeum grantii]|nr:PQQ-like beta-propeller repeat protein [Halarchaeum grantii]